MLVLVVLVQVLVIESTINEPSLERVNAIAHWMLRLLLLCHPQHCSLNTYRPKRGGKRANEH